MRGEIRGATVGVMMNDQPDFAVILPLAFLALGVIITLWGLSYARPARFDERALRRWRFRLMYAQFIPTWTARTDVEIAELTAVFRRQQLYYLTSAGVGIAVAMTVTLISALVTPDQALVNSVAGSMYGVALVGTVMFLAASIGGCLGYRQHFRCYPLLPMQPKNDVADAGSETDNDAVAPSLPAWRHMTTYRPWYVTFAPYGFLALYTSFTIIGAYKLVHAPLVAYSFEIDALADQFFAVHIWLIGLPIAFAALNFVIIERAIRAFVRSPERRYASAPQVSRYVNVGVRTFLVRQAAMSSTFVLSAQLFGLAVFFTNFFPLLFSAIIAIPYSLLSMIAFAVCFGSVTFPKAALTEAA